MLVDEATDDLAVLEDKRHFVASDLQYGTRTLAASTGVTESRIDL